MNQIEQMSKSLYNEKVPWQPKQSTVKFGSCRKSINNEASKVRLLISTHWHFILEFLVFEISQERCESGSTPTKER